MAETLHCWRCNSQLEDEPLPLAREATCTACGADLHVCRTCQFFDPTVANACRETVAERVTDKMRANFCGYLVPRLGPAATQAAGADRSALDQLFGLGDSTAAGSPSTADAARAALEALFDKPR